nr:retrovirus-related Pol polyprotein from transposon TNT 1-94 [Tanacetum cinerariifolium]
TTGDHRKLQLNELNELRNQAYENYLIYKERTKKLHDSKIKNRIFNVGDQVLLFNSRLKIFSGKLKTCWSGPFTIAQVFPYETVKLSQPDGLNFKVNGHRVKHYFGEDIPLKNDTVFHTEKTGMWRLVVEIDVVGITTDVVDKHQLFRSLEDWKVSLLQSGQRKPENQWIGDERKAANLDQLLKSLIMAMDLKLCYNTFKFKEGESLTQTFTRYKALMNELVNDGIKLSKLEINTGFINGLPKKWLSFCQSLRNTNNVKDSELASLFGKLKYEENFIDNIYETEKNKCLVSATPLSTAFFSFSIVQDFQDSPDDEDDTRSNHEYLNDLEEEFQARALLAKSKRFFKKAKYNKVKAKLALLSSSSSASKASMVKNKGLIVEAYEWDEEEVSSDDNEMVEVKVLMALAEESDVSKKGARNVLKDPGCPKHSIKSCTGMILPSESQRNTNDSSVAATNSSVAVTDSSTTNYDSADESLVCSILLPPLKKLDSAEPISGPKTIKLILRLKFTFKAEALKDVKINEPSSAPAKGKSSSASKVHSSPSSKLKSVKIKDDHLLAIVHLNTSRG